MTDRGEVNLECRGCAGDSQCDMYVDLEEANVSGITKDTFKEMDIDSKLGVLFDYIIEIQSTAPKRVRDRDIKCTRQVLECNNKFKDIVGTQSKAKVFNTGAAFVGGFIGGWSAVWTAFKFSILGG